MKLFIVFLSFTIFFSVHGRSLESVDDNDLVHLIKSQDSVVVLFTKNNCAECDEYENVLENIQDDLTVTLKAVVVKINNSPMVSIYDPSREPSLIYFRRGIPLLYNGKINDDDIMQKFSDNREPIVKELSDANFEHLTQASTGATTGDWFVFFYSSDCVICQRLYAVWEAVGADLKRRMNVARVNRLESGISTAKRFLVQQSPEFLYIRQGKFYRYKLKDYTPAAFIKFAEHTYSKDSKGENVPPIATSVIDIYGSLRTFAVDNPYIMMFGAAGLGVASLIALIAKYTASKKIQKKGKKTK